MQPEKLMKETVGVNDQAILRQRYGASVEILDEHAVPIITAFDCKDLRFVVFVEGKGIDLTSLNGVDELFGFFKAAFKLFNPLCSFLDCLLLLHCFLKLRPNALKTFSLSCSVPIKT